MFIKERHFPLSGKKWDANKAKSAMQEIAVDTLANLTSGYLWPTHPLDNNIAHHGFYFGTSGVSWAINNLKQAGAIDINFNLEPAITKQLKSCQETYPTMPHSQNASYLMGDIPILMMQYRLTQDNSLLNQIHDKIILNNSQPTREFMWGTAGTMTALTHLQRWLPNDVRWNNAFRVQASRLLQELQKHEKYGYFWEHDVYGKKTHYLGPIHGNSGNSLSLIKGSQLIDDSDYELLCEKVIVGALKTAITSSKHANWPAIAGQNQDMQLQHCHGAPGIINALSELPKGIDSEFDKTLLKGGELIWHAGPLLKGHGLCHGTAGNGFAFLKLFQRTNNEIWLNRARIFAMEGIAQYQQAKQRFNQGRYSLWNGDVGLALFINECSKETAQFPTIDTF